MTQTPPLMSAPRLRFPRWSRLIALACVAGLVPGASVFAAPTTVVVAPPATAENSKPDWTPTGWGGGGFYFSAAYHPTRDGVILLGMDVGGVAKSTDFGKTFRVVNTGLVDYAMYSLAIDVKNPDIAYAVTEGGLHKSTDGGETWKFIPKTGKKELRITAERNKSIRAIASDPSDSSIVYAATPGGKIYKSTDGAATWRVVYQRDIGEPDAKGLRAQFGGVNGAFFGGLWTSLAFPADLRNPSGIGLTLKGDGSGPDKAFISVKTSDGFAYRTRDISEIFSAGAARDVVFGAADFGLDPEFAKKSPEKAAVAPKTPDWSKVNRVDLSRVSDPAKPSVLHVSRVFFAGQGVDGKATTRTARDFETEPKAQSYGNIRFGGAQSGTIYSVAVSTKNPSRVIAATEDHGLVLSEDKGATWRVLTTPVKAQHATFDPSNADVIYGAFATDGVHKSTDKGATWKKISAGLGAKFNAREIAVSPANSQDVFLIGAAGWNGGFYYSNDAGESWVRSATIKPDHAANPTLPGEAPTTALSTPTNLALSLSNPKNLYISVNWRPVHSTDGGRTWEERVKGADITVQTDIRFSGDRTYVSAMDEGTLMSEDQGKTWKPLWPHAYDKTLSGHNWRLAVTNINGVDRIIATVAPWDAPQPQLVVISEDGGKTFKTSSAGLPNYRITTNTMWGRGYPRALAVDPSDPKIVYLGIDGDPSEDKQGGGIFKSVDGGYTWKQLPNQPGSRRMYYGLAIDPTNPKRILWGACNQNGGVWLSEDGGDSWTHVLKQDSWIFNIHVTPDGTFYAGGKQLWRSTDHGKTWTALRDAGGPTRSVVGIEVDPRDKNTMWVSALNWDASSNGDVYKTTDGGKTWENFTGDLMNRKPQVLRFNPKTNELWAGQTSMHKIKQ